MEYMNVIIQFRKLYQITITSFFHGTSKVLFDGFGAINRIRLCASRQ